MTENKMIGNKMTCEVCGEKKHKNHCKGCRRYVCDECYTECDCCGDIFCEECLEAHEEGKPIKNKDRERCPDCKSKNITLGKERENWYYCEDCGFHYSPR